MQNIRYFTNEEISSTLKDMGKNKRSSMLKSDTDKFDINKFYLDPINQYLSPNNQWNAIPKYEYNNNKYNKNSKRYGDIPKIHHEYLPKDNKRCYFWLYLDKTQKSSKKLFDILKKN